MATGMASLRRQIDDLEIEEWICERYGFVPLPFWLKDCKNLYLKEGPDRPCDLRHKCPLDKQLIIREAFVHFGLLPK